MFKTFYRWKILIADFFNKIPAVILIPGIIFASFLIAVLLIWSGTKVAMIDVAEPFAANSNTNRNKPPGSGDKNNDPDNYSGFSQNNPVNQGVGGSVNPTGAGENNPGSLNDQSAGGAQEPNGSGGSSSGSNSSSSTPANDNTVNQTGSSQTGEGQTGEGRSSSSSSSGDTGPEAAKRLPSYSYGSESDPGNNSNYNSNVSENCTYPGGDVKLWWRRAPKKQRDCYIKKNGFPDFLANEPYFCDYEKNEDCYVK